jgi:branched-chain amino acid transport system substrate-binding protein
MQMPSPPFDRHIERRTLLKAGLAIGAAQFASPFVSRAAAAKKYDTGATDSQIMVGNINPYSGPLSSYSEIGKTQAAYFHMLNEQGGINGRTIKFISYDDAYTPPKTVEQARRLVEEDEVLLIFNSLGTPPNSAIEKYMNIKKVPQLFVATGATKWNDPKHFPWTMGWQPSYQSEGRVYAEYLIKNHPNGKIAILYQDDDYGKDYVKGLKDGLDGKLTIAKELSYEVTEPTIDSQIITLQASGADVFYNVTPLEASAYPQQRFGIGRSGAKASGIGEFKRYSLHQLSEGPYGPAVEK